MGGVGGRGLSVVPYLPSHVYRVFSPPSSDDEMKDLLLQRRFRMLNWLEPHHLDVPLDLHMPEVQEQIIKGQQGGYSNVGVAVGVAYTPSREKLK